MNIKFRVIIYNAACSYAKAEGWGIISAGLLLIFKGTIILCVGQCGVDS